MDSAQQAAASSGAFQNITSYLNDTLVNLSSAFQGSNDYITQTLGVPPGLVYSSVAALVAVPLTMSRYGWSLNREQSSPFSSMPDGVPAVTDDDFSYITSQDLDGPTMGVGSRRGGPAQPSDDVLIIVHKQVTYPVHFPPYAIGDGKLRVKDLRDRVGLMMELPETLSRRIKLYYKGKLLSEPALPVRDYGVKNKSELKANIPDVRDGVSPSDEEMIVVDDAAADSKSKKKKKKSKSGKRKASRNDEDSASSPRDSASNVGASSPTPGAAPLKRIDELATEFTTKWLPLCREYIAAPPADHKKREEEHRKLSETVLQQILLKLDEVDTEGVEEVRTKRRALVKHVQDVLKELDSA